MPRFYAWHLRLFLYTPCRYTKNKKPKDLKLNDCQKEWINPHQGFSNVRTPEYIRNIFEICKDIWLDCDEKLDNYSRSVERKLREYEKDNIEKYVVLSESIKN